MAAVSRRTEVIVNVIVCVGAAIVLVGAWSKLLHLPFADTMLTIGLLTEAFIFMVYAFYLRLLRVRWQRLPLRVAILH